MDIESSIQKIIKIQNVGKQIAKKKLIETTEGKDSCHWGRKLSIKEDLWIMENLFLISLKSKSLKMMALPNISKEENKLIEKFKLKM